MLRSRNRSLSFLLHELFPEYTFGHVLIVRPAAEPNGLDRGFASASDGIRVIELEARSSGAASTAFGHKAALTTVALPDGALHLRRNAPGIV